MKNPRTVAYIFAAGAIVFAFIGIFSRRQPWPPDRSQKPIQQSEIETQKPTTEEAVGGETGLANPASAYCEEQGGMLEIIDDPNSGELGICWFDNDQSFCEEWEFYRGECKKGQHKLEDLMLEATPAEESTIEEPYLEPPTCSSCGE